MSGPGVDMCTGNLRKCNRLRSTVLGKGFGLAVKSRLIKQQPFGTACPQPQTRACKVVRPVDIRSRYLLQHLVAAGAPYVLDAGSTRNVCAAQITICMPSSFPSALQRRCDRLNAWCLGNGPNSGCAKSHVLARLFPRSPKRARTSHLKAIVATDMPGDIRSFFKPADQSTKAEDSVRGEVHGNHVLLCTFLY